MSKHLGGKFSFLMFVAATAGLFFAPTTQATLVTYDFAVKVISAPSLSANGTFSYNSSSITPGATNTSLGLLTALDFTFNGITYDATTANTGFLSFDANGDLNNIYFGTNCERPRGCSVPWLARSGFFTYQRPDGRPGTGRLTFALAAVPASVPEPNALGFFGFGALLIGLFVGVGRRRMRLGVHSTTTCKI